MAKGLKASEHQEQVALFERAEWEKGKYPDLNMLYAVPNGGLRHPAVAGKLRAEGVKKGVPDVVLPVPRGGYHGLYIEMKVEGNDATEDQARWLIDLTHYGYLAVVCFGADEAWRVLTEYMGKPLTVVGRRR